MAKSWFNIFMKMFNVKNLFEFSLSKNHLWIHCKRNLTYCNKKNMSATLCNAFAFSFLQQVQFSMASRATVKLKWKYMKHYICMEKRCIAPGIRIHIYTCICMHEIWTRAFMLSQCFATSCRVSSRSLTNHDLKKSRRIFQTANNWGRRNHGNIAFRSRE